MVISGMEWVNQNSKSHGTICDRVQKIAGFMIISDLF